MTLAWLSTGDDENGPPSFITMPLIASMLVYGVVLQVAPWRYPLARDLQRKADSESVLAVVRGVRWRWVLRSLVLSILGILGAVVVIRIISSLVSVIT